MEHSLSSKLPSQTSPLSLEGRLIAPNMADKSQTPAHPCPIAVVGMACRIPGGVSTPEDLWTLISRSRDGWCEIPDDRFSKEAYYHPNPQKSGAMNVEGGYFLKRDVSKFDAQFFNITKQEAIAMGKIFPETKHQPQDVCIDAYPRPCATSNAGSHVRGPRKCRALKGKDGR